MIAAFDDSAATYDEDFTNTSIGRLQRNKVWNYLERTFRHSFPETVLELNCGTGEDAVFLAEHGCKVLATDVSEKMLAVTKFKAQQKGFTHSITLQQMNVIDLSIKENKEKYGLVFSNFGGLNCINTEELEELLNNLTRELLPNGRIILVLMPTFCFWESLYFASKLKFKTAFRRISKQPVKASLGSGEVNTWYHNPHVIKKIAAKHFKIKNIQPIGLTIPPSYLQKTFLTQSKILNKLDALENKLNKYSFFSAFADHYLIDLELR